MTLGSKSPRNSPSRLCARRSPARDFPVKDLGAIFFVSVTGIASPSIDARLVNRMGFAQLHQASSYFRSGLRGRSGRHRACRRLRARVSGAMCRSGFRRAMLAHLAAGRSFGRRILFRRACSAMARLRWWLPERRSRRAGRRFCAPALLLSRDAGCDGLGRVGKRLSHCALAGCAAHGLRTPGERCGKLSGRQWP